MKISVLIPIHKTMDAPCVQSLVTLQSDLYMDGHDCKFFFANGFNAARARVGLTKACVEDKNFVPDIVLWLDSDHLYLKQDFDKLYKAIIDKNLPMLSASYKMRGTEETAHGTVEDGKFRHYHYKELNAKGEDDLMSATVVGFGFLLMQYDFLRKMWNKYQDNLFKLDAGENASEDVKFCTLVRNEGKEVLFHPKVRVGHMELCVRI